MSDTKDYYEHYWRDPAAHEHDPLAATRRRLLWKAVESARITQGSFLDCGSGTGKLVAEAATRGFEAVGLELSETAIETASAQFPSGKFICTSLEELPWPIAPGAYDVVVAFEVVEHLFRPRLLFEGAFDALRTGGLLTLTTPYHGRVKNLAISTIAFDRHFAFEGPHIRFPTDNALRQMAREVGFVDVTVRHFGRAPLLWAGALLVGRKP